MKDITVTRWVCHRGRQICRWWTNARLGVLAVLIAVFLSGMAAAEDWPTYMHDNHRSGATSEQLELPLTPRWAYGAGQAPRPSWNETPALQDFWNNTRDHRSRINLDRAFHVVAAGDSLYFGSSSSDKVVCLDTRRGAERWKFFTGGPVRFAPTVYEGKVYFGSDDGWIYCLNADNGSYVWKNRATSSDELMFANGRMVSVSPVRTGVAVDGGVVYWGAGLFSGSQTGLNRYICACGAETGNDIWKKTPPKPVQGYPLVSSNNVYMPAGKSTPTYYRRSNGTHLGSIGSSGRQGGVYALLSNDNKLFYGPHYSSWGSYIGKYDASTGASESVAWATGNHLVVTASYSYYSSDAEITKIRRSDKQAIWSVPSSHPYELILAGDTLFAGGDDEVAAISTGDGSVLWTAPVEGRVRSLAVANEGLYISTDKGAIHCFRTKSPCDLDSDGYIDWTDFVIFAQRWLQSGCGDCGGADLAGEDGQVNSSDLKMLTSCWLAD
ncbi:MAG: PQQ-binding-like beta-propeller repeat protein [Planctomycetes bacterium]|nr:PQQ-binding-like beta-propeller repeat protein [Planctomycetota bacterium]